MYWIEQHTDSKILKLGIKWALYREKKPDKKDYYAIPDDAIKADNCFSETIFKMDFENWEQSRIGYIKEPEFKVGERLYSLRFEKDGESFIYTGNESWIDHNNIDKLYSHYYEGKQVESLIKYVEKINTGDEICGYIWQEVEEPEPMLIGETKYHEPTYEPNPEYTQFQADKKQGKILAEI